MAAVDLARAVWAVHEASAAASGVLRSVRNDDFPGARHHLDDLQAATRRLVHCTDGPVWGLLARVPLVGRHVVAVQTSSDVVDRTAHDSGPIALDLARQVKTHPLQDDNGAFDLAALAALEPRARALSSTLRGPTREMNGVDTNALLGPLGKVTRRLQDAVDAMASGTQAVAVAARVGPPMLGADGPRTYLLVVQNNAEIRASGGLPGSMLVLKARNGRLKMGHQQAGAQLAIYRRPVLPLSTAELHLYGTTLGRDVRDSNLTPAFPRTAELLAARAGRDFHLDVDGVLSVDPVALSYVLRATGPLDVGGRTLTSANIIRVLLHDTYQRIEDPRAQDAYFATAARRIFDVLTSGSGDQVGWLRALGAAAAERRLLVWSAHPQEQAVLGPTAVSGDLLGAGGPDPDVGFYLNDAAGGKMEYYLGYDGSMEASACSDTGVQTLRSRMRLWSDAPSNAAGLSPSVTGPGVLAPRSDIKLQLRIYGPRGGRVTQLEANGRPLTVVGGAEDGHPVATVTLQLRPHEHIEVAATFRTAPGETQDPTFVWTPGIRTTRSGTTVRSACR